MKELYNDEDILYVFRELWIAHYLDDIRPKGTDLDAAVNSANVLFDTEVKPEYLRHRDMLRSSS